MTLSIKQRELNLIEREKQIIILEQKLYQQQKMLTELINKISSAKPKQKIPTIANVLERFTTKAGKDAEQTNRKYRVICQYIQSIGLKMYDKYSQMHNEVALLQIVQLIQERNDIHGDQKVRHLRWVIEFIKFAVSVYPDTYKMDVLIGLPSIKRTPKSARCPHTPYSDAQLKCIFNPKYMFFRKYPDLFWGCMIALFTGSRKNAVFTLQYKDIVQCDDVWCINFIADCPRIKKLKTEDSERLVPIHSTLIKIGFLNYVNAQPHNEPTEFIFKKFCLTKDGKLNEHITRKLFDFFEQIGIRNKNVGKYDFHSFRKNANITMEKCGMIRSYIDKIIGWQSRGSEGERSYSNYTIKQLSNQLELLRYDCLKHEFKRWKKIMAGK